ncbi:MAG TPA: hypothetical protein VKB88_23255 [Bryobacteraceae bacterium]|nr:hypothetical protein [Bryobacteraceae bacterium]
MSLFNRCTAILLIGTLLAAGLPISAKTHKGDTYLAEGRIHESHREWDAALECYEKALLEDPAELIYQMAAEKAGFQAGQVHLSQGLKLRQQGMLSEALAEFEKAFAVNPSSAAAAQETRVTREMMDRERQRAAAGQKQAANLRALTPLDEYKKDERDRLNRILAVPELKPLNPERINLKMNNKTKVLFETVAKYAGINVLWDPEFTPPPKDGFNVEINDLTIEQALDYMAVLTKSYWKPISPNTIFITMDSQNKRHEYEEWVAKTFYLQNIQTQQELQEVVNAVRTMTDLAKVYQFAGQNAVLVRGEADKVELAEKFIRDLDKPKAEIVVDIMVIEATSVFSRQITAALASTGLNVPVNFSPRSQIQVQTSSSGSSSSGPIYVPLASLGHISSADYATTLPGALLQAALSDAKTRILQAPQLRSVDNAKATLNIGTREPTAVGSIQPSVGGTGLNPLVNTQFAYTDVGVNVELTPRVHDNGDVTMHIKLDISNVAGSVNLAGITEPIIGQRKVEHDIRMREGEVGLLGGLINTEDDKTVTGIPGLKDIPLLGKFFSGDSTTHNRDELMIVLVPHVIRRPEIGAENLRPVATGPQLAVHLSHAAPSSDTPKPAGAQGRDGSAVQTSAGDLPATAPLLPSSLAPPATGTGEIHAHFAPSQADTDAGSSVTVPLIIDGSEDIASVLVALAWDPKMLVLTGFQAGDALARDGRQPNSTNNIQNDLGRASIQMDLPQGVHAASAGVLVTFTFQAMGHGTAQVTVSQLDFHNGENATVHAGNPRLMLNIK